MEYFIERCIEALRSKEAKSIYELEIPPKLDATEFAKILSSKGISLYDWHKVVLTFYTKSRIDEFLGVLDFLIKSEIDKKIYDKEELQTIKIKLLNCQAAYYLKLATKETEKTKREELFAKVLNVLNKSDRITINESLLFVLKGYLLFYQGSFDAALNYFENGQLNNDRSVTAHLGRACVEFCRKNFVQACRYYKKALQMNPDAPVNVRLGIAYCYYNVDRFEDAKKTFLVILKMDQDNIDAMIGLAIIFKREKNYEKYFEMLEKAWALNKRHYVLLLELSEHYMFAEDFEKSKKLAQFGLQVLGQSPVILQQEKGKMLGLKLDYYEIKSKFNYILGYYHHRQIPSSSNARQAPNAKASEFALKHYTAAIQISPSNILAQFACGQLYIQGRNYQQAMACYEYILKNGQESEIGECYRILGYLSTKLNNKNDAMKYYQEALKYDEQDYECMIEYASFLENFDANLALTHYEKALAVMEGINHKTEEMEEKIQIHPEIYNNIGILRMRKRMFKEAEEAFTKALSILDDPALKTLHDVKYRSLKMNIDFNMGILMDELAKFGEATEIFKRLIAENPFYFDAYLRLSYLAYRRGALMRALEYCDIAIDKITVLSRSTGNTGLMQRITDPLCMKGFVLYSMGDESKALSQLVKVKQSYSIDNDNYTKLFQATIEYGISLRFRDKAIEQKRYLKNMIECSKHVLFADEHNCYAALLSAVALAETGRFREARKVFQEVHEVNQKDPRILLNLAHLDFLGKSFNFAIPTYLNYLTKNTTTVYEEDIEVLFAIGSTYLEHYKQAERAFQKIILKNPEKISNRYNLCAFYQLYAFRIQSKKDRVYEETKEAVKYLKIIPRILAFVIQGLAQHGQNRISRERIVDTIPSLRSKVSAENDKLQKLAFDKREIVTMNEETFDLYLKEDKAKKEEKEKETEERRKLREKIQREKQEVELRMKLEKEREMEEKARKSLELSQQLAEDWARAKELEQREKEEKKKKGGKKGEKKGGKPKRGGEEEEAVSDAFIQDEDEKKSDDGPKSFDDVFTEEEEEAAGNDKSEGSLDEEGNRKKKNKREKRRPAREKERPREKRRLKKHTGRGIFNELPNNNDEDDAGENPPDENREERNEESEAPKKKKGRLLKMKHSDEEGVYELKEKGDDEENEDKPYVSDNENKRSDAGDRESHNANDENNKEEGEKSPEKRDDEDPEESMF